MRNFTSMASRLCVALDPRQRGIALDGAARIENGNLVAQYAIKCGIIVSDTHSHVLIQEYGAFQVKEDPFSGCDFD